MKHIRSMFRLGLALTACSLVCAAAVAKNSPMPALDFELSNGRQFVRLADLPARITVVNFWRYDCPACLREMPLLNRLARDGKIRVIVIALHRPHETMLAPAAVQQTLAAPLLTLFGPGEPRGLLARFGNRSGALPHTVVLDTERRPCTLLTGEISTAWVESALAHCPSNSN